MQPRSQVGEAGSNQVFLVLSSKAAVLSRTRMGLSMLVHKLSCGTSNREYVVGGTTNAMSSM
jgi:hypothetical protein